MHLTSEQLLKRVSLLIGVTLAVGMLAFFNREAIYRGLVALDLIPKPERLTELYFNDTANLPKTATSNQAIHFAFVIHNLEGTDYQYSYIVSVNAHGTKRIVDNGNVLVQENQYYVKDEQFNLLDGPGIQEVVVELTNRQQSIHFRTGQ